MVIASGSEKIMCPSATPTGTYFPDGTLYMYVTFQNAPPTANVSDVLYHPGLRQYSAVRCSDS